MQTTNKQSLIIDIRKRTMSLNIPQFVQGDTNILEAVIKDNGLDADLSNVGKVIANFKRQDKQVVSRTATVSTNVVTYEMGNEEMAKSGIGELELQFYNLDNSERLSTLRFKVNVMGEIGVGFEGQDGPTFMQELLVSGDYAKEQGDYAKTSGDTALTNWLEPVADYTAVTSIASPQLGDTVQTNDNGYVYRYENGSWKNTQQYGATALANVNALLAENTQEINKKPKKRPFAGLSLLGSMLEGKESQAFTVIGDSTGNEQSEWVYQLGEKIASEFPNYNVFYRLYNDVTKRYDSKVGISDDGQRRKVRSLNDGGYVRQINKDLIKRSSPDIDVRIKFSLDVWKEGITKILFGKNTSVNGNRGWRFIIDPSNYLRLNYSTDGTAWASLGAFTFPDFPNGSEQYLRFVVDVDNGSSGHTFTVYNSTDDGVTWVQIGTTTGSGVLNLFNSNSPYEFGGEGKSYVAQGYFYEIEVRDGIDGNIVSPPLLDQWTQNLSNHLHAQPLEGTPEIVIYNGSIPGKGLEYFTVEDNLKTMIVNSFRSLTFVSSSHNDRYFTGIEYTSFLDTLRSLINKYSYKPIVCMLTQNPQGETISTYLAHSLRRRHLLGYCYENNLTCIDVYFEFIKKIENGTPFNTLVKVDNVHPTTIFDNEDNGSELWANTVFDYLNAQ
jgi:hypothetical protein